MSGEWLDRDEALAALGIRPQTLYAYVSRGLIQRREGDADARRSLYSGDDIVALADRRRRGRRPSTIAIGAIAWGEPVITTAISTVRHGRLIYRNEDAVELSDTARLEDVAALLWQRTSVEEFPCVQPAGDAFAALAGLVTGSRSIVGRRRERILDDAGAAVAAIVAAMGGAGNGPVHRRLADGWGATRRSGELIRRALVVLADHELNPSTFAVRVAASTGASIPACLLAGLCALSGPKHGGAGAALAALVLEAESTGADAAVARWLAAGSGLPGFGHPLYPNGDPRAVALLKGLELDETLEALSTAVAEATGAKPNVDFGLMALTRAADLPAGHCFRLFAAARCVGWVAHAIEQIDSGASIRPRAKYLQK